MDLFENHNFIPMLLSEVKVPFNNPEYLFELKLDGTRTLIYASTDKILIKNRRGVKLNDIYPELLNIQNIVKKKTIFDGEIVMMEGNKPSFSKLQARAHLKNKMRINYYMKTSPVVFVAYDLLYDGEDITNLPLLERKSRLEKFKDNDVFVKAKFILGKGKLLYAATQKQGLEGIVAKKSDSVYQINKRTKDWLKIKNWYQKSFYICGYKEDAATASLMLGEKINDDYRYVGQVAIRKNNPEYQVIKKVPKTKKPVVIKADFNYLVPKLQCRVEFLDWTKNGGLRQPVYRGLDKTKKIF